MNSREHRQGICTRRNEAMALVMKALIYFARKNLNSLLCGVIIAITSLYLAGPIQNPEIKVSQVIDGCKRSS